MSYEINPRPYFQLLDAMFGPDKNTEKDYTDEVYDWFAHNIQTIEKVATKAEWRLMCVANTSITSCAKR